jgi:hypothetical protein
MPAGPQLLTRLRTACPTIHATRVRVLLPAVETDSHHQRLILTEPVGLYLIPRPTASQKPQEDLGVWTGRTRRELWLLGSSLSSQHLGARQIVALYRHRMQIIDLGEFYLAVCFLAGFWKGK